MRCLGCGFTFPVDLVSESKACNSCGKRLIFESDDFLLRQHGAPGRDVRPGQVQMGRLVERVIREHSLALIEAPVGCHGAGQEILMFSGEVKKVEDIRVGDLLCGDDVTPREVLKLIRGWSSTLLDIVPLVGLPWTVTLDHVLTVFDSLSGSVVDVSVSEWRTWTESRREKSKLFKVPAVLPVRVYPFPVDSRIIGFRVSDECKIGAYYGFTLSGNGRYLLGDFTVTHNSGKSDAYGVPAVITASPDSGYTLKDYQGPLPKRLSEGKKVKPRIVISTAKKNLQAQIANKDLPFIRERHGSKPADIPVVIIKGKSNYPCRLKAELVLSEPNKSAFLSWLDRFPMQDLSEFPGKRPFYLGDVTAEECIGRNCMYAKREVCGYRNNMLLASKASIVVANHHVVAYDLRFGPCVVLGPYTTLILDEAHQAPASFRAAFSSSITQQGFSRIIRQMDSAQIGGELDRALTLAWNKMFVELAVVDGEIPKDPFGDAGLKTSDVLTQISVETVREMQSIVGNTVADIDIERIEDESDRSRLLALLALRTAVSRTIETLLNAASPDDNTVLYVTTSDKGQKKLTLSPISVGKFLGPKIQMIPSVVITSATMAIGGKFDDIKYQLGLGRDSYVDENGAMRSAKPVHELLLTTPFNYDKQALLYTPRHIPFPVGATSPDRTLYISALVAECARLIRASNGNAFVLFTSTQDLADVHAGLLEEGLPNPLIIQEDDAAVTLRTFMATPRSVLLGVKSFWEGVDVQGSKLQLVIITKLPFPPVTDPVIQARSRQIIAEQVAKGVPLSSAKNAVFSRIQIPYMLTELRQGAGRLIRARTDTGVLAILDTRMFTGNAKDKILPNQQTYRGYGKQVVEAVGFNNHVFDFEVISRVFAKWNARQAA